MMRVMTFGTGLVCLFGTLTIRANEDTKPGQKPFDDQDFVQKAASGGMLEVMLGKMAASKATSDSVKKFGERMVTDHGKANENLKKAAAVAGYTVPDSLNEKDEKTYEHFLNYKGSDFDRDYVKHMLTDHEEDVALFTRASKEAKNPAIKDFATKTLPVLESHLEAVKKLQGMN